MPTVTLPLASVVEVVCAVENVIVLPLTVRTEPLVIAVARSSEPAPAAPTSLLGGCRDGQGSARVVVVDGAARNRAISIGGTQQVAGSSTSDCGRCHARFGRVARRALQHLISNRLGAIN